MRAIKFRAWDKEAGEMFEVIMLAFPSDGRLICSGRGGSVDNADVMQFIGLLDRNGKDIYESDIVMDFRRMVKGTIIFEDACFRLQTRHEDGSLMALHLYQGTDYEVLGNVYETAGGK